MITQPMLIYTSVHFNTLKFKIAHWLTLRLMGERGQWLDGKNPNTHVVAMQNWPAGTPTSFQSVYNHNHKHSLKLVPSQCVLVLLVIWGDLVQVFIQPSILSDILLQTHQSQLHPKTHSYTMCMSHVASCVLSSVHTH